MTREAKQANYIIEMALEYASIREETSLHAFGGQHKFTVPPLCPHCHVLAKLAKKLYYINKEFP